MRVALLAALSTVLVACGASTAASAVSTGTLIGRVRAGPTCPVERVDHPCPPAPVSATVKAKTARGQVVAYTQTDADGRYRFQLRPGTYTVVAVTRSQYPRCSSSKATVTANHIVRAPILCDTGIR